MTDVSLCCKLITCGVTKNVFQNITEFNKYLKSLNEKSTLPSVKH